MTHRYTVKDVRAAFDRFAKAYNLPTGPLYEKIDGQNRARVGTYFLDTDYGYRIGQLLEHGGQAHPFGATHYTAREFVQMVNFALDVKHQLCDQS